MRRNALVITLQYNYAHARLSFLALFWVLSSELACRTRRVASFSSTPTTDTDFLLTQRELLDLLGSTAEYSEWAYFLILWRLMRYRSPMQSNCQVNRRRKYHRNLLTSSAHQAFPQTNLQLWNNSSRGKAQHLISFSAHIFQTVLPNLIASSLAMSVRRWLQANRWHTKRCLSTFLPEHLFVYMLFV